MEAGSTLGRRCRILKRLRELEAEHELAPDLALENAAIEACFTESYSTIPAAGGRGGLGEGAPVVGAALPPGSLDSRGRRLPTSPAGRGRDAAAIAALNAVVNVIRGTACGSAWIAFSEPLELEAKLVRCPRALGLNLPRRTKRRLPAHFPPIATKRLRPCWTSRWALDFMSALRRAAVSQLSNVIDEGNREALAIEIAISIPSVRVIRVMEELVAVHGKPAALGGQRPQDSRPKPFWWCRTQSIDIRHIRPNRTKTPISSASIAAIARTCWMLTCLVPWRKLRGVTEGVA